MRPVTCVSAIRVHRRRCVASMEMETNHERHWRLSGTSGIEAEQRAAIDWLLFVTRCLRRWIESAKSNLQRMRDAH